MRNWAFLLNGRAQRVRTAIVLAATALMIAAIMVSLKQMPRAADAQVYASVKADTTSNALTEYKEDALAAFATDRTASRIAQFEALDRMIDAGGAHSDEAAAQKLKLVDFMEDETTVEGVLRAQGFKDAICTVHDDSCNVMVRAASLTDAQSAQILSVASAQTGLSPANIKIILVP